MATQFGCAVLTPGQLCEEDGLRDAVGDVPEGHALLALVDADEAGGGPGQLLQAPAA